MQRLVDALAATLQIPCALTAADAGGVRWTIGAAPPAAQRLPLDHLGRRLGWLAVPSSADAAALAAVLPAAAALVQQDAQASAWPDHRSHAALLQAALAGAGTSIWDWDIDTDVLDDIDDGLSLLGYATGERQRIGRTQQAWDALIHPEDRVANHQAYLRHARGEAPSYEHTYRALAADGQWRWLQERGRIVEHHADGRPRRMVGTQNDVTGRRAVDLAASETAQRLTRIALHVPGLLFQFRAAADGSAHFPYVSERCRTLFGLAPEQLMRGTRSLLRLVPAADRRRLLRSISASAASLAPWRHDFRVRFGDGAIRWARGEASPLRQTDGTTVWHGYMEDATERRDLEQARHDADVAAAANRAKTQFLSRMSHELRTPLNAVLGFTQLIEIDRAEPPTGGQLRRLKLVRQAGEHLLRMISDLLDLTRIESGSLSLQLEAVDVAALAAEAMDMLRGAADKAQVRMVMRPVFLPAHARADRTRLRQVLLNLLSNAVKYNRAGGSVEVMVLRAEDRQVLISVRDTGIGISDSDLPHLFEAFYRGSQTSASVEGAGIGLSVTHALVTLMGGSIAAESGGVVGSTFTITLPAAEPAAGA